MKIASMGADTLFQEYTIKEIQEIQKKLKNEIEKKKEELRQMVGERYRDLMETADTITDMKSIAENVTKHISSMQEHCMQFQQCNIQSGIKKIAAEKTIERKQKFAVTYSIAAQTKILMDIPTKIWSYMEDKNYLNCALLYLLACHTHASLLLDPSHKLDDSSLNSKFPIINDQWMAITSFHNVIIQNCQNSMETEDVIDGMTEHFCCIMLMTDVMTSDIFNMFLERRLTAIEKLFQIQDQEITTKTQACNLTSLLTSTLYLANKIFYPSYINESNYQEGKISLLVKKLHAITNKNNSGPLSLLDIETCYSLKYLPMSITEFRPRLKTTLSVATEEELKTVCDVWIQKAIQVIHSGLEQQLQYISTIKGLATIQEAVIELLEEISEEWSDTCKHILNSYVDVWDTFFKPVFINRIKAIISSHLKEAINVCINDIDKILEDLKSTKPEQIEILENELISYIWTESPLDLSPGLGWLPHSQRQLWDGGNIGMKAKGYTPKVQKISKGLDKMFETLVEDLSHFSSQSRKYANSKKLFTLSKSIAKLDLEDSPEVHSHLITVTANHINYLLAHIKELIDKRDSEDKNIKLGLLFLGQFCCSLIDLCQHIWLCLASNNSSVVSYKTKTGNEKEEKLCWERVKALISDHSDITYKTWCKYVVRKEVNKLREILNDCSPSSILKFVVQWDKIEIKEESEDGNVVKSTISIPVQISPQLHSVLYKLCCSINKAGGHALNRSVTQGLVSELFCCVLPIYKKAAEKKLSDNPNLIQTRALQMMFDIKFLVGLMGPKENSNHPIHKDVDEIITQLENQIDPFDLNVFTPLLQTNLRKVVHRSMLLLGLLTPIDIVVPMSGPRSSTQSTHSELHNLLPVSTTTGRFSLLPIVTKVQQSVSIEKASELSPLKSICMHSSSPNLSNSTNNVPVTKSASFYDRVTAMSSSWFGGQ
ncbi:conserved oligomeric Golgi complex subunit 1-like isoform X1 [Centruroides sculpturatus]|uniref:conserved oligomeric Golgi complex subunit 1-like isoform X1 n=1 Tax=Centruroides sculpturatus TaxID=218467 RepID=UPI000C6E3729|nr:conserved oligomeric Golgi complex subunit 1-like isoform X1 [Centruroides sculpturatus]XP_023224450.1 conserved oligomeric Golgi complex subunit 1-like isoform X1 [Centruroides sculpturatus]